MKKILLPCLMMVSLTIITYAQDVKNATIKWTPSKTQIDGGTSQSVEVASLITYGSSRIEWSELGNSVTKNFRVTEVMGEWPIVNQEGWMQYEVTDGIATGTIAIRKYETETRIFITIASQPVISYILTISNYQVL